MLGREMFRRAFNEAARTRLLQLRSDQTSLAECQGRTVLYKPADRDALLYDAFPYPHCLWPLFLVCLQDLKIFWEKHLAQLLHEPPINVLEPVTEGSGNTDYGSPQCRKDPFTGAARPTTTSSLASGTRLLQKSWGSLPSIIPTSVACYNFPVSNRPIASHQSLNHTSVYKP